MEKLRVYELIDTNDLIKNEQLIKSIFFKVLKVPKTDLGYQFSIAPVSGWMNYANNNELYSTKRKKTLLPDSSKDAEDQVRKFIQAINQELRKNESYKKSGLPLLFPANLYLMESTLVFQTNKYPDIDHWLIRLGVHLESGNSTTKVDGAVIEVRVGNNENKDFSQIIGFSLRWTPYKSSFIDDAMEYVPDDDHNEHEHDGGPHTEDVVVVYKLDGESIPQNYLAPFYTVPNGHHVEYVPASKKYSISARIYEVANDTGKELYPEVKGGSGDFIYEWGFWEQAVANSALTVISDSRISVPIGVFNVVLNVIDRKTAVFCQTQSTIYSLGSEENRYKPLKETLKEGCMHPLADNYDESATVNVGCVFSSFPAATV